MTIQHRAYERNSHYDADSTVYYFRAAFQLQHSFTYTETIKQIHITCIRYQRKWQRSHLYKLETNAGKHATQRTNNISRHNICNTDSVCCARTKRFRLDCKNAAQSVESELARKLLQTHSRVIDWDWLIEHRFTSAPTQYRLYGRRFLQVWWPNQQCQSTEGGWLVIQTGLNLTRLTSPCYNTTTCMQI